MRFNIPHMQFRHCDDCGEYKYIQAEGVCPSCFETVSLELDCTLAEIFYDFLDDRGYDYEEPFGSGLVIEADSEESFYQDVEDEFGKMERSTIEGEVKVLS